MLDLFLQILPLCVFGIVASWPWGYGVHEDPNKGVETPPSSEMFGPFALPTLPDQEFGPIAFIKSTVSKLTANQDRVNSANHTINDQGTQAPAWYDISGRISKSVSAVNDAFQSTLIKVIVLVVLVGAIALFGLSYVQAKGASLGK